MRADYWDQELLWGVRAWQLALALFLFIISFFAKTLVTGFFNGWLKKRAANDGRPMG